MVTFDTTSKDLIVDSRGVNYVDFRNSLRPNYTEVWLHIALGYVALLAILACVAFLQHQVPSFFLLTIPLGALLMGYVIAYIHLFMHEASHFNIAADKKWNDVLANAFIGVLVGMDIEFYRAMHIVHHRFLGTTKDTEKSYFEPITWRFVFESITGIRVLKVLAHRNENMKLNQGEVAGLQIIKKNNRLFLFAATLNVLFVVFLFYIGYWQVALSWLVGFGAIFPFFASFRQILEHRRDDASATVNYNEVDHGASHRMFGEGIIAYTMGPAGFNRHLLHHWDPQVSYTRLKEVETFLEGTPLKSKLQQSRTTYWETFTKLFNK